MPPIHVRALSESEYDEAYKQLADEIGDDGVMTRGERKYLPQVMMDDELLLWMSSGILSSTGKEKRSGGMALIALTDRRILFLDKRLFGGIQTIAMDLDKVNSITGDTGIFFGSFKIQDGGDERKIDNVSKKSVPTFVQQVQRAIEARKLEARTILSGDTAIGTTAPAADDVVSQLERLAALRERGILTEDEFAAQKWKILNS